MFYGTRITFGIQSWQVVQTYDGAATVRIGGSWRLEEGAKRAGVASVTPEYRLAREDDNSLVYDWTPADDITDKTWEAAVRLPGAGCTGWRPAWTRLAKRRGNTGASGAT